MTAPDTYVGIDFARPGAGRSAASIWWRGRPLEVEARHFVTATARVSGLPRADLLSRRLGAEVVTWRRRARAARWRLWLECCGVYLGCVGTFVGRSCERRVRS